MTLSGRPNPGILYLTGILYLIGANSEVIGTGSSEDLVIISKEAESMGKTTG